MAVSTGAEACRDQEQVKGTQLSRYLHLLNLMAVFRRQHDFPSSK